jgi:hypothetical protein
MDADGSIYLLTTFEPRVAENRQDCHWLHDVTGCKACHWLPVFTGCIARPTLEEPFKNPARFPWREVKKVDQNYLSVDVFAQLMQVRESPDQYGSKMDT